MLLSRLDATLSLELLAPHHADELFALTAANRDHLRAWLPWAAAIKRVEDTRAFIDGTLKQHAANDGCQTAIRWQGRLVGVVGVHGIQWQQRSSSIGYWLAADAQGHGVMTRCCRAWLDYLFGDLALQRVEIRCADGNHRSRAIPQRLGFREETRVPNAERLPDRCVDHIVYALLATQWRLAATPSQPEP